MGIVRPYEIIQIQEIYIKAQFDYLESVAEYNMEQYRYQVAIGMEL